jgi:hypothetical protein
VDWPDAEDHVPCRGGKLGRAKNIRKEKLVVVSRLLGGTRFVPRMPMRITDKRNGLGVGESHRNMKLTT